MKIVERREHDGVWWARDADGAWFRWNAARDRWDGPLEPPWPAEEPHPDEAAIVAAAMAAGQQTARALGDPVAPRTGDASTPMNRVDAWWNRHFPPFTIRRLVFGLVALPLMAALTELLWVAGGRDPSLPRYLFVCIAGCALLAIAWLPGMREMAERLQAAGEFDIRSPWPWRRKPGPAPAPPLPSISATFGHDFRVALPFALVMMLVMTVTVAGVDDAVAPSGLLTSGLASVFAAAVIALRTSVWGLALFSIAGGVLGGLAVVFLSLMTFSDPSVWDFVIGWAMGSVLLLLYAYPMWTWMRRLEARGFRLPMWIVMGGSVLLVSGAALVFVAER